MGKEKDLKLLKALQKCMLKKWVCIARGVMVSQVAIPGGAAVQLPCAQSQQCSDGRASLQARRATLHERELGCREPLP